MSKGYKDLVVWQRAVDLVPTVYEITKSFPSGERYALTDQIRRAVVSVPANIAEGQARRHQKEFRQHLSIAKGSLAEVDTLLIVANRLGYVDDHELAALEDKIMDVRKPLLGLMGKPGESATHNPQPTAHTP